MRRDVDMDAARGWAVVAAAAFCLFFTCGFSYSTGVYYVVFLETFGGGKGMTAWISSLNFGFLCAFGPASSLLVKHTSCRSSVFVGGVVSTAGLVVSAFVCDVRGLCLTFGVITGAGFGLVFTPCVIVVSEYFMRYRPLALGLCLSGAGLGTTCYPWLMRYLLASFGWRGALAVSGAINAHVCAAALLMRPNRHLASPVSSSPCVKKPLPAAALGPTASCSLLPAPTHTPSSEPSCVNQASSGLDTQTSSQVSVMMLSCSDELKSLSAAPSLTLLQQQQPASSGHRHATGCAQAWPPKTRKSFILAADLDVFVKPMFILICANTFLFCFSQSVMYTHISAYGDSVGLTVRACDILISGIGVSSMVGRIALGMAANSRPLAVTWLFIGAYGLAGLGAGLCGLLTALPELLAVVCLFGFFSAGFGPLLAEVTLLAVGVRKFSMAYGYLMIFMAGGTIIGAPVAGFLYDVTRLYRWSFYISGAALCLASGIMLPDVIRRRRGNGTSEKTSLREAGSTCSSVHL